jgi:catechol 2,3-dioxygenase-like lactoylglutathione lyase family enzyme
MSYDQCASVGDQLAWLDELGFEDAECFFRSFRFAVFGAWKAIPAGAARDNRRPSIPTSNCRAEALSPIIPVADMLRSIRFYEEVLGFHAVMKSDSYSIVSKDGASLHLTLAENQSVLDATRGHLSVYLEVQDIESLWSHVFGFKSRYKIRDLFDREYGMREFHIIDPDDCLIFVGQQIQKPEPS